MDYEYEYGRYKKKVEDQQKQIEKLQEQLEGMKQVLQANNAIIAAILLAVGATEDNHLDVPQEIINEALQGKYQIMSRVDQEAMVHMLYVAK